MTTILSRVTEALEPEIGRGLAHEAAANALQMYGVPLMTAMAAVIAHRRETSVYGWPALTDAQVEAMMDRVADVEAAAECCEQCGVHGLRDDMTWRELDGAEWYICSDCAEALRSASAADQKWRPGTERRRVA